MIHPAVEVSLPLIDLSRLPANEREARSGAAERRGSRTCLRFGARATAASTARCKLEEDEHVVLFTMHHIMSDGWSMGVLVREVAALYEAYCRGARLAVPGVAASSMRTMRWQREWLQGDVLGAELSYWREQLAGAPPVLELPTDHARPAVQSFAEHVTAFMRMKVSESQGVEPERRSDAVHDVAGRLQMLLWRYSGQEESWWVGDANRGTNAGRERSLIGFFVNTLVLRTEMQEIRVSGSCCSE